MLTDGYKGETILHKTKDRSKEWVENQGTMGSKSGNFV